MPVRFGRVTARAFACIVMVMSTACAGAGETRVLTADMPLHLEDHLDAATFAGSEVSTNLDQPVEWRFDQPQPDWKPVLPNQTLNRALKTAQVERTTDALRVTLPEGSRQSDGVLHGGVYVDLPGWRREEWVHIVVRARTSSSVRDMMIGLNPRQGVVPANATQVTLQRNGGSTPIVSDGSVQSYQIRPSWGDAPTGPWLRVGLDFRASEPGSIDILSVSVVPIDAVYADAPHGVRPVTIGARIRRTLYTHAPGSVVYRVRVPDRGRLDVGLGVLRADAPVKFAITARQGIGDAATLFEERYANPEQSAQRSVDLSKFAGQTVTLALTTNAEKPGTVALWGSPTLSGERRSDKPNVIFYVIDGGGADQMSVYGYNRRTTPNLEKLAAEGALFEHAYSNASWTEPSTPSFMTSLHSSVLGIVGQSFDDLPAEARTMAERFHEAGYPTAVFTSNSSAGSSSGLQRGVDLLRDQGVRPNSGPSVELHRNFWDWRAAYPAEPYWVHFQTTDVHRPHLPPAPFAGLFASPEQVAQRARWDSTLQEWSRRNAARAPALRGDQWAETGIDRVQYYDFTRSRYDETMAHQDYQIGRFVERLRATGQWDHTLLIIAADHGTGSGSDDFLKRMFPTPVEGADPILSSFQSRIPLMFFWPGRIAGGQRFRQPVSMIDVLPTVLEFTGLPMPDVMQGQSLAPLLLGRAGWKPRPVIFDEFEKNPRTGELQGQIEMIDGQWGASLWIGPLHDWNKHRGPSLLLFDVWNDPMALTLMNDAHPELVKKYTELLEKQWKAHRLLAQRFTPAGQMALAPQQLESLRALGYIR